MMDVLRATGKVLAHVLTLGAVRWSAVNTSTAIRSPSRTSTSSQTCSAASGSLRGNFSFLSRQEAEFDVVGYWTVKQPRPR